ncbi:MAG: MazG nucleotide pyrophosphohydrolase domain-containing protein [Thermotogota bacterium]|nr:MazG nucleotide pyrophosphohydrolase domain-containing protein [Thermotogota bacterium]
MEFQSLAMEIHENAKNHGWWDKARSIPELLCLVHSEVSEALEAYRNEDKENFAEELADIIIRVFDMAVGNGINIQEEVVKKHMVNTQRAYRHGGKKC